MSLPPVLMSSVEPKLRRVRPRPSAKVAMGNEEMTLTLVAEKEEAAVEFARRLAGAIGRRGATVLLMMIYGDVAASDAVRGELRRCLGRDDWPVLWVEGASCTGGAVAGAQVFVAGEGARVRRITAGGRVVGTVFDDGEATHCLLGGLTPRDAKAGRAEQTRDFFAAAQEALAGAGFDFGDVARTWFYNDDILAWYDDFNRVRTAFYRELRFTSGSLPASTAVRGRNPDGAALTFGGWAVRANAAPVRVLAGEARAQVQVREVASPLQCPALAYGSSFSRAMEIVSGGRRRLFVSGTASIEPGGKTVWVGDVRRQVGLTMEVVAAILHARGLGFGDVTRATAYFKHAADAGVFKNWCAQHGLAGMPVVPVHCDICRDDLLFEIELDACADA